MLIKRIDMNECVRDQLRGRGILSAFDANETATFARELEWVQAGVIEKKFPNLVGAQIVPISGGAVIPGARSHTYREVTSWGEAEVLEEFALDDFPSTEASGTETTGRFRSFGAKYSYTFEDLRARPSQSWDPITNKQNMARKAMEEKLDKLLLNGHSTVFTGLLANGNSIDDSSSDDWETGTEAGDVTAILATFRRMVKNARIDTKGVYNDFDFVVSLRQSIKLNLFVPATTVGGGTTVGDFLVKHVQGVRSITASAALDGQGGGAGIDRMLAYPRDPEVLDALVPVRFEQFAPQLNGMAFVTPCHGKYGGLRIFQPKAIRRADVTMT